ncbi:MAG: D-2-hydroxyacid dehydrogenase [Synergistaceae bacterium]|jgi:phosphoglycerate dehydrogenase-like enzyme|nr:D-2-hydroxyacid dehydrogenase [Synergistaceae bacterium]
MPDLPAKRGKKLNVMILTAKDSLKVFRMTEERLEAALERYPQVREIAEFFIVRTTTSYENDPSWNDADREIFARGIEDADALIGYMFPFEMIAARGRRLKWIHIIGAGVEHLHPLDWLPEGVALTNNRGAHAPKTYEYAMMAMLMLGNHMPRLATAQRERRWDAHFVSIVKGGTALIIGAGKQGSAVAKAARALGVTPVGVDPLAWADGVWDDIVRPERLRELLPAADYVFLTLPATAETTKFFGRAEFGLMKESAGLVNISRGRVLDTDALIEALDSGKISGAVLDVFDPEPLPPDSPLWTAPNLTITPHMGCDDEENYIHRTFDIVMDNLLRLNDGVELQNKIDPAKGY